MEIVISKSMTSGVQNPLNSFFLEIPFYYLYYYSAKFSTIIHMEARLI